MKRTLLYLAFLFIFVASCTNKHKQQSQLLAEKIHEEVLQRDTFQISAITGFEWDTMYVVTPYASGAKFADERGFSLDKTSASDVDLSMRDDANILLFVNRGKAIAYCEYPISWGNFAGVNYAQPVIRQQACCVVDTANRINFVTCVQ